MSLPPFVEILTMRTSGRGAFSGNRLAAEMLGHTEICLT